MSKNIKKIIAVTMMLIMMITFVACEIKEDKSSKVNENASEKERESESKKESESDLDGIDDYSFKYIIAENVKVSGMYSSTFNGENEDTFCSTSYNRNGVMVYYWYESGLLTHIWEAELDKYGNTVSMRKFEEEAGDVVYHYIFDGYVNEYNEKGLLTKTTIEYTDELPETMEYTYDEFDNVIKYVFIKGEERVEITYEYDEFNNCIKEFNGETTTTRKYDSNGNILEEKVDQGDREVITKSEYDKYNRLVKISTSIDGECSNEYIVEYNNYGNIIRETVIDSNAAIGEMVTEYEYEGDYQNFTITKKTPSINRVEVCEYEECKLVCERTYDNDEWVSVNQYFYYLDDGEDDSVSDEIEINDEKVMNNDWVHNAIATEDAIYIDVTLGKENLEYIYGEGTYDTLFKTKEKYTKYVHETYGEISGLKVEVPDIKGICGNRYGQDYSSDFPKYGIFVIHNDKTVSYISTESVIEGNPVVEKLDINNVVDIMYIDMNGQSTHFLLDDGNLVDVREYFK